MENAEEIEVACSQGGDGASRFAFAIRIMKNLGKEVEEEEEDVILGFVFSL